MARKRYYVRRRTFRGFLWYCWGMLWWPLCLHVGVPRYMRGHRDKITIWLLQHYGNVRNPEWPSRNELKWMSREG